jgi:hypothetical protein
MRSNLFNVGLHHLVLTLGDNGKFVVSTVIHANHFARVILTEINIVVDCYGSLGAVSFQVHAGYKTIAHILFLLLHNDISPIVFEVNAIIQAKSLIEFLIRVSTILALMIIE